MFVCRRPVWIKPGEMTACKKLKKLKEIFIMGNVLLMNSEVLSESPFSEQITQNRIEALKALAILLLREVESLEKSPRSGIRQKVVEKINLSDEVHRFEIELILDALLRARGNQRLAANLLGTKISTLNVKIKRYGIDARGLVGNAEIS